jgi:hypothetical protein
VYYLFSRYARLAEQNATGQSTWSVFNHPATTQREAGVEPAGAAVTAPQAAVEASPHAMSTATQMLRPIVKVVEGMRLSEGAGVQIRRTVSQATAAASCWMIQTSQCYGQHVSTATAVADNKNLYALQHWR